MSDSCETGHKCILLFQSPTGTEGKIINTHVVVSDQGQVEATYEKSHLFDLDIPGKIRLCGSDYTVPGREIVPPVSTPIGRVGLATVSFHTKFA